MSSPQITKLIAELHDKEYSVRLNAAHILGELDEEAVPALLEALKAKVQYVRWHAIVALGTIADIATVPFLIEALEDRDSDVRKNVYYALGRIGDVSAVPALIESMKGNYYHGNEYANEAMQMIGSTAEIRRKILMYSGFSTQQRIELLDILTMMAISTWITAFQIPVPCA